MIDRAIEAAWLAACAALGRRMTVRAIPSPSRRNDGPLSVLALAPHPDDEVAGCAGTLCLHARAGDRVAIAIATDGGGSGARAIPREEMVALRTRESCAAHAALGIDRASVLRIDLPEPDRAKREHGGASWSEEELADRLAESIDDLQPDLVYAPSRVDGHPDHLRAARALARALERAGAVKTLARVYQVHVPLTPILVNVAIDTSRVTSEIARAIAAHASQKHSLDRTMRMRRHAARLFGADVTAEPFLEVTAADYCALHQLEDRAWAREAKRFFGVRPSGYRDAWAYLAGAGARFRIRRSLRR
jgi:LmbE family N-acetylglucosaminyl deacetylase